MLLSGTPVCTSLLSIFNLETVCLEFQVSHHWGCAATTWCWRPECTSGTIRIRFAGGGAMPGLQYHLGRFPIVSFPWPRQYSRIGYSPARSGLHVRVSYGVRMPKLKRNSLGTISNIQLGMAVAASIALLKNQEHLEFRLTFSSIL